MEFRTVRLAFHFDSAILSSSDIYEAILNHSSCKTNILPCWTKLFAFDESYAIWRRNSRRFCRLYELHRWRSLSDKPLDHNSSHKCENLFLILIEFFQMAYGYNFPLFLSFDLNIKALRIELQRDYIKSSQAQTLTFTSDLSFDSNTKFYLCSDKGGASPNTCTVSEFIFEYRYYGEETYPYTHLSGTYRIISERSWF